MKKKIFISLIIIFSITLQIFPVLANNLDNLTIWSDNSNLVIPTSNEPTFDIASEAGILIEVTTRKSFI